MGQVFISYSREDTAMMGRVRDYLREAGFTVWTDEGISPGTPSWKEAIETAIQQAECVVVLFSPSAEQSRWVRNELDYADTQGKLLYPLLVRGTEANAIPFGYTSYQFIDLRQDTQHAAGFAALVETLRSDFDGTPITPVNEATVSPVPPSQPAPESSKRRQSSRWWGIAALVLVVVFGGAGIFFINGMSGDIAAESTPDVQDTAESAAPVVNISSDAPATVYPPLPDDDTVPEGYRQMRFEDAGLQFVLPFTARESNMDVAVRVLRSQIPAIVDVREQLDLLLDDNTDVTIYLDFINPALYGVFVDELPIVFSQEALIERYRGLWDAFGADMNNIQAVSLPAGEGFTLLFTPETVEGVTALGQTVIVAKGRTVYAFLYATTTDNAEQTQAAYATLLSSVGLRDE